MKIQLTKDLLASEGPMRLDIDLDIPDRSFITIYGPSGAGKTSILRMIAGLMKLEAGYIEVGDTVWFDSTTKINLKPQVRNAGLVFQDYALFPNMTVFQNVQYAFRNSAFKRSPNELIDIFDLAELKDRKTIALSGGQKQRVALARALANNPKLLLLDEPLSALDYTMRLKLQDYLQRVHSSYDITIILISHDIGEIIRLCDTVYILKQGKIERSGTPSEVFSGSTIPGKFQITGEILEILPEDVVYVVSVLCGTEIIKAIVVDPETQNLQPGDKVMVASKSFNPMIKKIVI